MRHVRLAYSILLGVTVACASGSRGPKPDAFEANVITAAEIRNAQVHNAEEAVRRLRPKFLGSRGPTTFRNSPGDTQVYLDDAHFGSIQELRGIEANIISEIRFLTPTQAQARFGRSNNGSVILVLTRKT